VTIRQLMKRSCQTSSRHSLNSGNIVRNLAATTRTCLATTTGRWDWYGKDFTEDVVISRLDAMSTWQAELAAAGVIIKATMRTSARLYSSTHRPAALQLPQQHRYLDRQR
jgi:hypothetical protein